MADESGHEDQKHAFISWGGSQPAMAGNRCETCHASLDVANSRFSLSSEREVTVKLKLHKKDGHNVFTMNEVP